MPYVPASCPRCASGADGSPPAVVPLGVSDGAGYHYCPRCQHGYTLAHLVALAGYQAPRRRDARSDLLCLARALPLLEGPGASPAVWERDRWSGGGGAGSAVAGSGRGARADARSPELAAADEVLDVLGYLEAVDARSVLVLWTAYVHVGPDAHASGDGTVGWYERVALILASRDERLDWLLEGAHRLRAGRMYLAGRDQIEAAGRAYEGVAYAPDAHPSLDWRGWRLEVAERARVAEEQAAAFAEARRQNATRERQAAAVARAKARANRR